MVQNKRASCVLFVLVNSLILLTKSEDVGVDLLDLDKRGSPPLPPDCSCTAWDYVDQCGDDCRQLRWRDCEPSGCAVEDESVPCFSVEWEEWGSCDRQTCSRTRSQACMCLMRKVSPAICMVMNLQTETEDCEKEVEPEEWGSCGRDCKRYRGSACKCIDTRTRERIPIRDSECNINGVRDRESEDCVINRDYEPWGDCDDECEKSREAKCVCNEPGPSQRFFDIDERYCNGFATAETTMACATEWGSWIHKDRCPDSLPEGRCSVTVSRFRNCYCINEDDQDRYAVRYSKCGNEPFRGEHQCDLETCMCMVVPGPPPVCPITCEPVIVYGSDPTCECTPVWYEGICDPDQMKPEKRLCPAQPAKWGEWGDWSSCNSACRRNRFRSCGCNDGSKIFRRSLDECQEEGEAGHSETEDCEREYSEWRAGTCPKQKEGDCGLLAADGRECRCAAVPSVILPVEQCAELGEHVRTRSCPLAEPCECIWVRPPIDPCPNEKRCTESEIPPKEAECRCRPEWHTGSCDYDTKPPTPPSIICHATEKFEWEEWLPWSSCNVYTCKRSRRRKCTCEDDIKYHLDTTKCGPREDSYQEEFCETVWGPWENGCPADSLCEETTATLTRDCCCLINRNVQWEGEEALERCRGLDDPYPDTIQRQETCRAKSFELSSWSRMSECDDTCNRNRQRSCTCTDELGVYEDRNKCLDRFPATQFEDSQFCNTGWSDWSDANCGEISCIMKARPRFRMCMCENGVQVDTSICGKPFEIAVKCPFIPPEDPRCQGCECTEWTCSDACDNTLVRQCGEGPTRGCDIEAKFEKGVNCCLDREPCSCTEWECKDSCDATMVRSCDNQCDIEEKSIAGPCCVVEEPCVCSEWECKPSCDNTMVRVCNDGCDVEEKEIAGPCCGPGSGDGSLGTGQEREEEEEEDDDDECSCGKWVGVACVQEEVECLQEEWRVCTPKNCDDQVRNVTSSCCDNDAGSGIPEDCSACGRWIDIGDCKGKEGETINGTHQWRSVRNCDRNACEEFRCVSDGKHCVEELCGAWYDIGTCDLPAGTETGIHQWRETEECFCEPYRCTNPDPLAPDDISICSCTDWIDMSGCDDKCVNTVSRTCDPPRCAEEWRIQSGFCCN